MIVGQKYTVQQGYIILDENSEVVDWFDTQEEAEDYANELKIMNEN